MLMGSRFLPQMGGGGANNVITFQTNKSGLFNPSVTVNDGSIVTWDYGDGNTSTGATANRTYPDGSTKTVTVTFANPAAVTHLGFQSQSLVGEFTLVQLGILVGLLEFRGYSNGSWNVTGGLAALPSGIVYLLLYNTNSSLTGYLSDLPDGMIFLHLGNTNSAITGVLVDLPSGMTQLWLYSTGSAITGSIADLPSGIVHLWLIGTASTIIGGASAPSATGLLNAQLYSLAYTEAQLDELLGYIYTHRALWTNAAPILHIGGSNPAPSGVYQDGDPPTTGKEYVYELENDPESQGFNTWAITYTA
jgi:hypothetical protein